MSTASQSPAVECKGLAIRAGKTEILHDISLRIEPEEHVLLVGPSGAGKSTLLRAIAGLAEPSEGEIYLFGKLASKPGELVLAPQQRGVGFLFQGGALWPHMSVAGTLDFVLKRKGQDRPTRKRRIQELLEIVDLDGYDARRAPTLSGGEAQRLGLARALATDPKILALDEPLGPLDAPRREALLDQLQSLSKRFGLTTIHVTHDPAEAERVATRTISMTEAGELVA